MRARMKIGGSCVMRNVKCLSVLLTIGIICLKFMYKKVLRIFYL
jgi:hypothetical protein